MRFLKFAGGPAAAFLFALFLSAGVGTEARADCCNITQCVTASDACNIFCCNCDGPCSNYGVTCANGPVIVGDVMGNCPGYQNCTSNTFCNPGTVCCQNNTMCCSSSSADVKGRALSAVLKRTSSATTDTSGNRKQVCEARFKSIDTDNSGAISSAEFKAWAKKSGFKLSDAELNAKFKDVDKNGNGSIEPGEVDSQLKK